MKCIYCGKNITNKHEDYWMHQECYIEHLRDEEERRRKSRDEGINSELRDIEIAPDVIKTLLNSENSRYKLIVHEVNNEVAILDVVIEQLVGNVLRRSVPIFGYYEGETNKGYWLVRIFLIDFLVIKTSDWKNHHGRDWSEYKIEVLI